MTEKRPAPTTEILDDSLRLSLDDITQRCAVETRVVIEMVEVGLLRPRGQNPHDWNFSGHDLLRLHRALRLRQDLDINLSGLALAVELLEEIERLRTQMRQLQKRSRHHW